MNACQSKARSLVSEARLIVATQNIKIPSNIRTCCVGLVGVSALKTSSSVMLCETFNRFLKRQHCNESEVPVVSSRMPACLKQPLISFSSTEIIVSGQIFVNVEFHVGNLVEQWWACFTPHKLPEILAAVCKGIRWNFLQGGARPAVLGTEVRQWGTSALQILW